MLRSLAPWCVICALFFGSTSAAASSGRAGNRAQRTWHLLPTSSPCCAALCTQMAGRESSAGVRAAPGGCPGCASHPGAGAAPAAATRWADIGTAARPSLPPLHRAVTPAAPPSRPPPPPPRRPRRPRPAAPFRRPARRPRAARPYARPRGGRGPGLPRLARRGRAAGRAAAGRGPRRCHHAPAGPAVARRAVRLPGADARAAGAQPIAGAAWGGSWPGAAGPAVTRLPSPATPCSSGRRGMEEGSSHAGRPGSRW